MMPTWSRRDLLALAAVPALAQDRSAWRIAFEYDDLRQSFRLADLAFVTPRHGLIGALIRSEVEAIPSGRLFVTSDAGKTWQERKSPTWPVSFFVLNEANMWMVGQESLLFSPDRGVTWKKLSHPGNFTRVHFLNPALGFAWGGADPLRRTENGGQRWDSVTLPDKELEKAVWTSVHFFDASNGLVAGYVWQKLDASDTAPDGTPLTRGQRRRLGRSVAVFLRTSDAGNTWSHQSVGAAGELRRLRIRDGRVLGIFDAGEELKTPAQVVAFDPGSFAWKRIFRADQVRPQDVWIDADGTISVAAFDESLAATGRREASRARIFQTSGESGSWSEMKVHYRARDTQCMFRAGPSGEPWLVLGGGIVLRPPA